MSNSNPIYSFPLKEETKIDMENQRAMIKVILKLKSGNFAVGSHGAVISIWIPKNKKLFQAWRAQGRVNDLIEMDNGDLISACSGGGSFISIYRYEEGKNSYKIFGNIKCKEFIISSLAIIDNNTFVYGSIENNIVFWKLEENDSYKKDKEIKLEDKEEDDCIYAIIKISNGNFISTGFSFVKLINSVTIKSEKDINFSQPSCLYEDSEKNIWVGNSPGSILVVDSELNKLKETQAHKLQINKFLEFNNHIISASTDFTMKIWDINSFECLDTIKGYGEITAICLINEGCLVTAQGIPQTDDIEYYDEEDLLQFLVFYESEKK